MSAVDLLHTARVADRSGYDSIWYPDSRFLRDPFVGLALLAQTTTTPILGLATTDPFARHPALIASAAASVLELAGDRLTVALGAGSSGLRSMGIDQAHPVEAVGAAIRMMRALLRGEAVTVSDDADPIQLELPSGRVGLWIATRSPRMLRLAGRLADGTILGHLCRPEAIDRAFTEVTRGAATRDPDLSAGDSRVRLQVVVGNDESEVDAAARQVASWVLRQHAGRFDWLRELGIPLPDALEKATVAVRSPRDPAGSNLAVPDAVVRSLVLRASGAREAAELLSPLLERWDLIVRLQSTDDRRMADLVAELAVELDLEGPQSEPRDAA